MYIIWGSGCGSFGRVVAADTRGMRFKSSHRWNVYLEHLFTINCIENTKIKNKVKTKLAYNQLPIQIIEKTVHNLLKVRQLLIAPLTEIDISTASSDEN